MPTRAGARVAGHRANRPLVARGRAAAGDEGLRLCPGARVGHTVCLGSLGSCEGGRSESDFGDKRLKGVLGSGVQVRAGASVPLPRPLAAWLGCISPSPAGWGALQRPSLPSSAPEAPPRGRSTEQRAGMGGSAALPVLPVDLDSWGAPSRWVPPKKGKWGRGRLTLPLPPKPLALRPG